MMGFEYDSAKSKSNLAKHGIDFERAQQLWDDPDLVSVEARTQDEPRSIFIGRLDGKHWSAIATRRGDVIRIISVRRSRPSEVALYES
jgi:hypothetical protein